jgi:RHS repeat-associated protein
LELIGRVSGNTRTYAHQDGLGSTRLVTSSNGNVSGTTQYDAFGAPRNSSGTQYRFGFTGEQLDSETGFIYLRARYMDPSQGRFLTKDSFSGFVTQPASLQQYGYVANNPVNLTDPSGMTPCGDGPDDPWVPITDSDGGGSGYPPGYDPRCSENGPYGCPADWPTWPDLSCETIMGAACRSSLTRDCMKLRDPKAIALCYATSVVACRGLDDILCREVFED